MPITATRIRSLDATPDGFAISRAPAVSAAPATKSLRFIGYLQDLPLRRDTHRNRTGAPFDFILWVAASMNSIVSSVSVLGTGGFFVSKKCTISITSGR